MVQGRYIVVDWLADPNSLQRSSRKSLQKIARMELTASVLSVNVAYLIRRESNLGNNSEKILTDSQVVLAYTRSTTKRFLQKGFIANWMYTNNPRRL